MPISETNKSIIFGQFSKFKTNGPLKKMFYLKIKKIRKKPGCDIIVRTFNAKATSFGNPLRREKTNLWKSRGGKLSRKS